MDAEQLLEAACEDGIACLSPGQLLIVYAQALASTLGMNAEELLEAACESGIACLSPGQLQVVTAEASRQIAAGGGGSGTTQVFTPVPPAPGDAEPPGYLAYPTGGGNLLQWDGANWV